jgi:hypothetical protein
MLEIVSKYLQFLENMLKSGTPKGIILFHLFIISNIIMFIAGFSFAWFLAYQIANQLIYVFFKR